MSCIVPRHVLLAGQIPLVDDSFTEISRNSVLLGAYQLRKGDASQVRFDLSKSGSFSKVLLDKLGTSEVQEELKSKISRETLAIAGLLYHCPRDRRKIGERPLCLSYVLSGGTSCSFGGSGKCPLFHPSNVGSSSSTGGECLLSLVLNSKLCSGEDVLCKKTNHPRKRKFEDSSSSIIKR